jgi:hypothetical protein
MAESMTGYGRGEYRSERYQVGVEIKSVNHRFLEVKLRIPRELNAREQELRAALRERFGRGAVDATVQLERQEGAARRFVVDEALLAQAAAGFAAAADRLGVENRFDLAMLSQFREIFRFEAAPDDLEELHTGTQAAFTAALDQLASARRREGAALAALRLARGVARRAPADARAGSGSRPSAFKMVRSARPALRPGHLAPSGSSRRRATAMKSDVAGVGASAAISGLRRNRSGPPADRWTFCFRRCTVTNTAAAKANTSARAAGDPQET